MTRARHSLSSSAIALLLTIGSGCSVAVELGPGPIPIPAAEAPAPAFPECRSANYDYAGEGTLRGLGLEAVVPAELPEPDRPATIWVTHELLPHDLGPPGGAVQRSRMLCFEFADGSGGSEWPVDDSWRPPGLAAAETEPASPPTGVVVAGIAIAILAAVSVLAFRRAR